MSTILHGHCISSGWKEERWNRANTILEVNCAEDIRERSLSDAAVKPIDHARLIVNLLTTECSYPVQFRLLVTADATTPFGRVDKGLHMYVNAITVQRIMVRRP